MKRKCKKDFYQERKVKTPAQIEKHLKVVEGWNTEKIISFMDNQTVRTETGVKLVPVSDFGESVKSSLQEDFGK